MVESDAIDDLVRETIKLLDVECLCWRAEPHWGHPVCVRTFPSIANAGFLELD